DRPGGPAETRAGQPVQGPQGQQGDPRDLPEGGGTAGRRTQTQTWKTDGTCDGGSPPGQRGLGLAVRRQRLFSQGSGVHGEGKMNAECRNLGQQAQKSCSMGLAPLSTRRIGRLVGVVLLLV